MKCGPDNCLGLGNYNPLNTTCSSDNEYPFYTYERLMTQAPGPISYGSSESHQNVYVASKFIFPCSGHIQGVTIRADQSITSLQSIHMAMQLWRIHNATNLFEQRANFTMRFSVSLKALTTDKQQILLSADLAEGRLPQFELGDILGFAIPANSSIRVSTVFSPEGNPKLHHIMESPANCTFINTTDTVEPLIAIRVGKFVAIMKLM